jgi:GNAT superfamily N-acetyltransferase
LAGQIPPRNKQCVERASDRQFTLMSHTIRRATVEDLPRLVELLGRQMEEHELASDFEALARAAEAVFNRPELGRFVVAAANSRVVGVAYVAFLHSMEHGGTVPLLEELYVVPECRGSGIGGALLQHVVKEWSIAPGRPLELEVDASHRQVEAFYARHGFTRRDRTRWIHFPPRGRG